MIILNSPETLKYQYTCACGAELSVEPEDLECYPCSEDLGFDYLICVRCVVCGARKIIPHGLIPMAMLEDLEEIANELEKEQGKETPAVN